MIDTSEMDSKKVLSIAYDYCKKFNINHIVIASTTGTTAMQAMDLIKDVQITVVTHSTGFREDNQQEMQPDIRDKLENKGIQVLTSSMLFHSWNDYYRKNFSSVTPTTIMADTLRLFGQGMKVCIEAATMASDAGLIPQWQPIVSVAGTGSGSDTAILMKCVNSRKFFDTKVMDIIGKPKDW